MPMVLRFSSDFNPRSREGSDQQRLHTRQVILISIHAPARGATILSVPPEGPVVFQSTLPRGERRRVCAHATPPRYFNPRSREGSDMPKLIKRYFFVYFNPRSREGSDAGISEKHLCSWISIHAPARGATPFLRLLRLLYLFQSTLPRGERLVWIG